MRPATLLSPDAGTRYSANVEPLVRVDLAFKRGGYVAELLSVTGADGRPRHVQDGDQVQKGQILCRLRDPDYRVKVAQARAAQSQAEAALAQARQDFDRAQPLAEGQAIPRSTFDGARNKLDGTRGVAELARATVKEAELALDDTVLRSPIDGVVMKRLIEVGSLVGPGIGGFVLADVRSVKVVFGVPDRALGGFPIGTRVPVRVDAITQGKGADTEGRVTRVSPYADPRTRVFDVEVEVPNDDGLLKPGMIAAVAPAGGPTGPVTVVPLEAVIRPPGASEGYAVIVLEDKGGTPVARVRVVHVGEVRGGSIEVPEGIKTGERVVVSGASQLSDGQAVTVVP